MRKKSMKAEEFDKRFDNGEDIIKYLDFKNAERKIIQVKNQKKIPVLPRKKSGTNRNDINE